MQNGRWPPSYFRSTEASVTVELDSRPADLAFVQLALQANHRFGRALRMPELAALWLAWKTGTVPVSDLAAMIQHAPGEALEGLQEAGFVQVDGDAYKLSSFPGDFEKEGPVPYIAPEDAILTYVARHGRITRKDAAEVCGLTLVQAGYILKRLVADQRLRLIGKGRYAYYQLVN